MGMSTQTELDAIECHKVTRNYEWRDYNGTINSQGER